MRLQVDSVAEWGVIQSDLSIQMWLYYVTTHRLWMKVDCTFVACLPTEISSMCCRSLWSIHCFILTRHHSWYLYAPNCIWKRNIWDNRKRIMWLFVFFRWLKHFFHVALVCFPDCFLVSVSSRSLLIHPTWDSCSSELRTATHWPSRSWRRWDITRGFTAKWYALIELENLW